MYYECIPFHSCIITASVLVSDREAFSSELTTGPALLPVECRKSTSSLSPISMVIKGSLESTVKKNTEHTVQIWI